MSQTSLAKINRPKTSGVLERQRLFAALDSARERPIVWISSPAGSGKTTLVSSYIDARNLKSLWYQVDEGDNDSATFFYYMSLAGKKANPWKKKNLPLLTPEYLAGIPTFAKRFFEDLFSRLKPPFAVVLDNYQEVDDNSPLHDIIRNGLSLIPPGITILIISRVPPPPVMASLRAAKAISTLEWEQLRLERDELQDFVRLSLKHTLRDDEINALYDKTGGWAAGLVLLLEQGRSEKGYDFAPQEKVPQEVFDYFASEIFSRVDEETRDFLMKSALFPVMTVDTVSKLTGFTKPSRVYSYLCEKNYFTLKRPGKDPAYEYHPMFKEFLLRRMREELNGSDMRRIRNKAGAIMESAGQAEAAADLYIAAGEWESLGRLICEHSQSLIRQGRTRIIEVWLSTLPDGTLQEKPWLLYWHGVCRKAIDPGEARDFFARSYSLFKSQENPEGIFLSWSGVVECFVLSWSDFTALDYWVAEIEEIMLAYPDFYSADIDAQVVSGVFCALMYRQPYHPDMAFWEERVRQIVFAGGDLPLKIIISSHLIFYYTWWTGEQAKAMLLVNALRSAAHGSDIDPLTFIVWKSIEAAYHWMTADNKACLAAVEKGLETATGTGIHIWNFMLSAQASFGTMTAGDTETAGKYLRDMAYILHTNRRLDISHYHYHLGWESMYHGNISSALEHMKIAVLKAQEAGVMFIHAFSLMGMAEVMIEQREFDKAGQYLEEARQMGRAMKSNTVEYQYQWLQALRHLRQNQLDEAEEHLRKHLAVSRKYGILNHACWRTSIMQQLYEKALEAEIEVDHVQDMIVRHNLIPDPPPSYLDNWPWTVKVYVMGMFSVEVDGNSLSFTGKTQKKPLELLQAIVAFGGEDVSEEKISEALWPDSDGDLALQTLRTTVSRLRKLIKHEKAIIYSGGKITLDRRYVWTDAWAFEHEVKKAANEELDDRALQGKKTLTRVFRNLEQYRGVFLPGQSRSWVMPMRERLRNKYLASIMDIGGRLESAGEIEWALEYYWKGLEVDKLIEGLYQRLIACYGSLGRGAEAVHVFNECRKTLGAELGIEPSKKTAEILKRYVKVTD